jgi:hypothetical protein
MMDDEKPSPFADLLTGTVWIAVSAAIVIGAWNMDRLERLSASFYTAPGLVPGMLGLCIGLMSLILIGRSLRAGALASASLPQVNLLDHWRLIISLSVGLFFSIFLVGRGLPFWAASAIYIAVMVFVFQFPERRRDGQLVRGAAIAVTYGALAGLAIHYLFQDLFLVRLP